MSMAVVSILLVAMLGVALLLVAGGVVLLVLGSRRRDDSTSRPFLAFGVTLLVLGTVVLVPALLWGARSLLGLG
ncbi:hypothetical protein [Agrococcus baldri]|uniref:Uncharacterized protein n=1 Tax=Agrococcus baldri TaxID=153730 RepID=A0AA87UW98_9MICO|nr:hypothetical protein [Agrococcus baldri]GEK79292.1 hypothetical protein ABA31_06430 [Agrococcus baldri]